MKQKENRTSLTPVICGIYGQIIRCLSQQK